MSEPAMTYIRISQKMRSLPPDQLETSIKNAIAEAKFYCQKNYLEYCGEFIDRAVSGDDPNRPEFQRMLEYARAGKFKILLVRSLSRFTREGSEKQEDYIILLAHYGVKLVSLTEDTTNELSRLIFGFVNRIPIILARMGTRQMRSGKKSQGLPYIRSPFGYDKHWKIIPKDAEKVRQVFALAKEGWHYRKIIQQTGVSEHLYYRILQNPCYVGVLQDGSWRSIIAHKHYIRGSDKKVIKTEIEAYFGSHEGLVSPHDWLALNPNSKIELIRLLQHNHCSV